MTIKLRVVYSVVEQAGDAVRFRIVFVKTSESELLRLAKGLVHT